VNLSDIFKVNKEVDTAYDPDEDNYLYHLRNNAAMGFITSTIAHTLQNTFKGIKAASKLWLEVKKLYGGTRDVRAAYHLKVISHIKYSDLDSVEKLVQQFEDARQNLETYKLNGISPEYYILLFLQTLEGSPFKEWLQTTYLRGSENLNLH